MKKRFFVNASVASSQELHSPAMHQNNCVELDAHALPTDDTVNLAAVRMIHGTVFYVLFRHNGCFRQVLFF
jgi:hypothetical protein